LAEKWLTFDAPLGALRTTLDSIGTESLPAKERNREIKLSWRQYFGASQVMAGRQYLITSRYLAFANGWQVEDLHKIRCFKVNTERSHRTRAESQWKSDITALHRDSYDRDAKKVAYISQVTASEFSRVKIKRLLSGMSVVFEGNHRKRRY